MGQVFRTFENDTVGVDPAGFTRYGNDVPWPVDDQARVKRQDDGVPNAMLALDEVDASPGVVQVATRFQQPFFGLFGSAAIHDHVGELPGEESPGSQEFRTWRVTFLSDRTELEQVGTVGTFTLASWPFVLPRGEWVWVRMEREATSPTEQIVRAKAWQGLPGDEPVAWDAEGTTLLEGPLSYGFGATCGIDGDGLWDRLGVGWDGDPAPLTLAELSAVAVGTASEAETAGAVAAIASEPPSPRVVRVLTQGALTELVLLSDGSTAVRPRRDC